MNRTTQNVTRMKIYTRTGDEGKTGLFGGPRVTKDSARIEAYGAVDELNAALGLARAQGIENTFDDPLARVQNELFNLGAALASPGAKNTGLPGLTGEHVVRLEQEIDGWEATLLPLTQFILPGGALSAAQLHVARTICRRAERRVVTLAADEQEHVPPTIVIYLNRLSDWLFVLARAVNQAKNVADVPWRKE